MPGFLRNFIFQRMQKKAGDLAVPALTKSVGRLGPRDLPGRFTPTQPLRSLPGAPVQAPGVPKPPVKAPQGVSPYVVGGTAVGGGAVLGGALAATNQIEGALNQVGPAVDRFFGAITPQAIQNFGREQEKRGWGGALEMATPFGFLAAPFIPNTPAKQQTPMQRAQVGQPMVLGGRLGYKAADGSWQPRGDMESENIPQYLPDSPQADKSGYVWDAARQPASGNQPPGPTPPVVGPQLSPEERAYNAERSRIAQLTEQNPEFQNIGQLRNDLRDQGMAIWAAKYGGPGGLASKVKPGQSGYDVVQKTLIGQDAGQAARQAFGYQTPQQITFTPPPGVSATQGFPLVQSIQPAEAYTTQGLQLDPEMTKKFQSLLNQAQK